MKLVPPYAQNVIELLRIEDQYGDPYYHLVGPYHWLDTRFWWIDRTITRALLLELYTQRAECLAYQVSRQSYIIFMFIALMLGVLVYAATK